ncbi:MAG: aromatic ring-hydroxylating dioxygenase subunit alpha [Gammaproteobacteria bacterium]
MSSLDKVQRPTNEAYSLPPACYRDARIFMLEQEHLFASGWIGFGRADDFEHPGDYVALTVADTPLVAILGTDREIRVFANTCRHRGMRLIPDGRGRTRQLACPFHGWCYALDGRLTAAPRMESATHFDMSEFGLVAVSSAVRAGFVFAHIGTEPMPIDDWLGNFEMLHAPWRLADMKTASRREFTVSCNWKLFIEVFNEYYHLRKVHPRTLSGFYRDPDPPDHSSGAFISQFGEHAKDVSVGVLGTDAPPLPTLPGLSGRLKNGTRYTWVYPNLSFAASRDAVWMLETVPLAPARTAVRLSLLFDPSALAAEGFERTLNRYQERMQIAMDEDIAVLEAQQIGMSSRLAQPGRICAALEPSVHEFHVWYADQLIRWGVAID